MYNLKKYKCITCNEMKLVLEDGVCLSCLKDPYGKNIKNKIFTKEGLEVKSKTGKKDENIKFS